MSVEESIADLPLLAAGQRKRRLPLLPIQALLDEQQSLTAVERFSRLHDAPDAPLKEQYYRDLMPLSMPRAGEQLAFEVDLDRCTGCKACVSACHTLNGLDDQELWRTVGLLHGGTPAAPAQQTITTSCHHCLEPACLKGCPTQAYEKDPVTGIVKHLDDQCFGCQYCTLMCPYDAPKYNPARGIVRKCDMCSDRLAHGEAPACVQACPSAAIAIRVVERASVVAASDAQRFLPGTPAPAQTLPTTQYKTARSLPNNLLPADFYSTRPEHAHLPLVVMLTLTQLAVGSFAAALWTQRLDARSTGNTLVQALVACAVVMAALAASVFHLGRPLHAWRAIFGLRTSWLSREALVFGGFAQGAVVYAAVCALPLVPWQPPAHYQTLVAEWTPMLRLGTAFAGLLGVYCSIMVYVATQREHWSAVQTGSKFFGTTLLLGASSVFAVSALTGAVLLPWHLLWVIVASSAIKLSVELHALSLVRDVRSSAQKRMATVMLGELRTLTWLRFGSLILGGVCLPLVLLTAAHSQYFAAPVALTLCLALLLGELCERYLFFRAAPASRMPGALK